MRIALNGTDTEIPAGLTIGMLLERMGVQRHRVAVEKNSDVVPKKNYEEVTLNSGDVIEVVAFVGGG
ncbi:MAG: sulfur carrier protein ThiS [Deltaproteobacteria bacterium]|nr:sulfur carrier protein ThiS [Deltaproteobacteria bacterium]